MDFPLGVKNCFCFKVKLLVLSNSVLQEREILEMFYQLVGFVYNIFISVVDHVKLQSYKSLVPFLLSFLNIFVLTNYLNFYSCISTVIQMYFCCYISFVSPLLFFSHNVCTSLLFFTSSFFTVWWNFDDKEFEDCDLESQKCINSRMLLQKIFHPHCGRLAAGSLFLPCSPFAWWKTRVQPRANNASNIWWIRFRFYTLLSPYHSGKFK